VTRCRACSRRPQRPSLARPEFGEAHSGHPQREVLHAVIHMLASSPLGRRAECLDHSNPILRGAEVSATVSVLRRDAAKTAWSYSNTPAEPSASAGLVDLSG